MGEIPLHHAVLHRHEIASSAIPDIRALCENRCCSVAAVPAAAAATATYAVSPLRWRGRRCPAGDRRHSTKPTPLRRVSARLQGRRAGGRERSVPYHRRRTRPHRCCGATSRGGRRTRDRSLRHGHRRRLSRRRLPRRWSGPAFCRSHTSFTFPGFIRLVGHPQRRVRRIWFAVCGSGGGDGGGSSPRPPDRPHCRRRRRSVSSPFRRRAKSRRCLLSYRERQHGGARGIAASGIGEDG